MPGMDGHQVLQQIENTQSNTDIIILSGEATFENDTRAFHLGISNFLRKPYIPEDLITTIKNVLIKRELELKMSIAQAQLQIAENRHNFIINNSPDIIYMLDKQGRFSFVNDRVESLLGYTKEELIGKHYSDLSTARTWKRRSSPLTNGAPATGHPKTWRFAWSARMRAWAPAILTLSP